MEVGWSVSQNVSKLFIQPPEKVSLIFFLHLQSLIRCLLDAPKIPLSAFIIQHHSRV